MSTQLRTYNATFGLARKFTHTHNAWQESESSALIHALQNFWIPRKRCYFAIDSSDLAFLTGMHYLALSGGYLTDSITETEFQERSRPRTMANILDLPPELRNRIYELVIPSDRGYKLNTRTPALARTCRLLRSDVLPMWRGRNVFTTYRAGDYLLTPGVDPLAPDMKSDFAGIRRFIFTCRVFFSESAEHGILDRAQALGKILLRVSDNTVTAEFHEPLACTRLYGRQGYSAETMREVEHCAEVVSQDMVRLTEALLERTLTLTEFVTW